MESCQSETQPLTWKGHSFTVACRRGHLFPSYQSPGTNRNPALLLFNLNSHNLKVYPWGCLLSNTKPESNESTINKWCFPNLGRPLYSIFMMPGSHWVLSSSRIEATGSHRPPAWKPLDPVCALWWRWCLGCEEDCVLGWWPVGCAEDCPRVTVTELCRRLCPSEVCSGVSRRVVFWGRWSRRWTGRTMSWWRNVQWG